MIFLFYNLLILSAPGDPRARNYTRRSPVDDPGALLGATLAAQNASKTPRHEASGIHPDFDADFERFWSKNGLQNRPKSMKNGYQNGFCFRDRFRMDFCQILGDSKPRKSYSRLSAVYVFTKS